LRAADLKVLAGDQVDFAGHIRVVVPASNSTFVDLVGSKNLGAYYSHGVHHSEPVILAPSGLSARETQIVAHELAHAVSYYLFPEQRRWFLEGVAEFFRSLGEVRAKPIDGGKRAVVSGVFGDIPDNMRSFAGLEKYRLPSEKILNWNGVEDKVTPGLYHRLQLDPLQLALEHARQRASAFELAPGVRANVVPSRIVSECSWYR
jgi:hypothetical protein